MAKMIHDSDVALSPILNRRVAVIGYGSQGHAHALNLKDSGIDVRVGVRPGSRGWQAAEQAGFSPLDPAAAARWADIIMMVVPDLVHPVDVARTLNRESVHAAQQLHQRAWMKVRKLAEPRLRGKSDSDE